MIGSCTGHLEMPQTLPCEMLKRNTMQQNSSIAKLIQNMRGKQLMIYWEEARSKILLMKLTYQGKQLPTRELVNVFNDYFTDVGPTLPEKIEYEHTCSFRDFISRREPDEKFIFQPVNVEIVYRLITKLTISKATGVDDISAKVLKAAGPAIAEPLTRIFNMSIASGKFPMEWKAARLTPIFKKGQRSMLDNYRPISILPVHDQQTRGKDSI